jgi:hypothetical protein
MKKSAAIIVGLGTLLVIAGSVFYYVVSHRENTDFKEGLLMPREITIIDDISRPLLPGSSLREGEKEIQDQIVVKTLYLELEKAQLQKATQRDMQDISGSDRMYSIKALYNQGDSASGRVESIEVLKDGSFVVSKLVKGKHQYAKGQFGPYTIDYLIGLYTLNE